MKLNRRLIRFQERIDDLVETISKNDTNIQSLAQSVPLVERAVLQLQIEWDIFVRGVILDSATGKYENGQGVVYSRTIGKKVTREQARHALIGCYKKRKTEPDWYVPSQAIQAAAFLDLTNLSEIAGTLGATPWIIEDLRYVRNFITHQSKDAALKLREKGLTTQGGRISPMHSACAYGGSGAKNYIEWSQFMKILALNLVS